MKKLKILIVFMTFFLLGMANIKAAEEFYDLNIDVFINEDGSANIEEKWHIKVEKGTELYKTVSTKVLDFKVVDESGRTYTYLDSWDINASFSEKAYKNGINKSGGVYELCWGKSTMGEHTYAISYKVQDFIFNTDDYQVAYYKLVDDGATTTPKIININVRSFFAFEKTLPVWGYGYKGLAFVDNGYASFTNDEYAFNKSDYIVVLMQFPSNTYTTDLRQDYKSFQDVLTKAQSNSYKPNYDNEDDSNTHEIVRNIVKLGVTVIVFAIIIKNGISSSTNYKFGEVGKKINMKEINNFRDIPYDKDIFKAFWFAEVYDLNKKKTDVLGSIILKWLFEDQIKLVTVPKEFLKKETTAIDLTKDLVSTSELELKLYNIMKIASKDNILETKELEKWCKNNYNKFFNWFDDVLSSERDKLITKGLITAEVQGKMFKTTVYNINPKLKEEAIKLAGLKKFLEEFSLIKEKTPIEVKLWKEYLMYAQILGIADKVAKTFKNLYPELIEEVGFNYNDIILINSISNSSVSAASSARTSAQNYSSGGGGFSSMGGGGGSFGGGSGWGSR